MSEAEVNPEKIAEKIKGIVISRWFWIVLAILIIAGMYISAKWFWETFKGGKKE